MSTIHLAAYDETGCITHTASGAEETTERNLRLNTQNPFIALDSPPLPAMQYVKDGELRSRPAGTAHLVGNLLKGVPAGAHVTIEGVKYEADGTDIELSFDTPGLFVLLVSAWPAVTQEFVYENQA